jgi:hypothetical protein
VFIRDLAELIQIDKHQREHFSGVDSLFHAVGDQFVEIMAVRQFGQAVVIFQNGKSFSSARCSRRALWISVSQLSMRQHQVQTGLQRTEQALAIRCDAQAVIRRAVDLFQR